MLSGRENGRNDNRSGMHGTAFESVIEVLAVSRRTVDEGRVVRAEAAVMPDRRGVSGRDGARPHSGHVVGLARGHAQSGDVVDQPRNGCAGRLW
jgi:hypothetical protein